MSDDNLSRDDDRLFQFDLAFYLGTTPSQLGISAAQLAEWRRWWNRDTT